MRRRVLLFLLATTAHAQHIDFARIFPPEATQRDAYALAMTRLDAMRGRIVKSPSLALERYNAALRAFERLDAYLYLRYAVDTTNVQARNAEDVLSDDFVKRTAFFFDEARQVTRMPAAGRWFFENARHAQPAVGAESLATSWASDLHDLLDSEKRPAEDKRELYAFTLLRLARAGNAIARLRGAEDAAASAYSRSGLAKSDVTRLLDGVAAHSDLYKRYRLLRAHRDPLSSPPRFTLDETRTILRDALAPAGAAYAAQLSKLLDPTAGRIDLGPGEHRKRGGFSKGFPGFVSVFYMHDFDGSYNAVRIIAHESTHALQRQLEADRSVPAVYIEGPKFLAESYAMFHELLLPDDLAARENDPARKAYFLEQFLDSKGLTIIFVTAAEAAFEQEVYDGVAKDTIRTADDLDKLALRTAERFGIEKLDWHAIGLMYEDPFYDVNYTVAGLVALSMYARWKADPSHFAVGYAALLANGYTDSPDNLLKRFVGIDIHEARFIGTALDAARQRMEELAPLL